MQFSRLSMAYLLLVTLGSASLSLAQQTESNGVIVFVSDRDDSNDDNREIYSVDVATSVEKRLTTNRLLMECRT